MKAIPRAHQSIAVDQATRSATRVLVHNLTVHEASTVSYRAIAILQKKRYSQIETALVEEVL